MTDYTGKFGPLFLQQEAAEWPMYSFERPAHNFWNGVANELERSGLSESQIRDWLQSKDARWMLDSQGKELYELGVRLVRNARQEGVQL